MKKLHAPMLVLAILFAAPVLAAEEIDLREHIEVVGTAEMKLVPNEFVLHANLTSFDKSLKVASANNGAAVRAVFNEMKRLGVARKYVVTDAITVNAVTEGYREQGNFRRMGFNVSRDVMVVLHEPKQIEPAMKVLFAAGVDRLHMTTSHTNIAEALENTEIKAANAATKKAKRLSSAVGRILGRAVAIAETHPQQNRAQNFVYTANTPNLGDAISLGKLSVRSSVAVKFVLEQ